MPMDLPLAASSGLSIKKSRHILAGAGDLGFELTAQPGSAVLAALLTNTAFPPGAIALDAISVKVDGEKSIPLGAPRGTVTFNGSASGYQGLAVVDAAADVTALLVRDQINDDLARGLGLERAAAHRYVVLRWGYDLQGAVKGAVALGAGPKVTFGAEGKRLGAFAIVHAIPADRGAADALKALFESWMVPSQFRDLDDLTAGSSIVAEVDGSIALTLGAQYGYDFNWVRDDVAIGGLAGDIGLKVQVGVSATFGFEASGQYAVALSRPLAGRQLRVQIFRLDRKGLSLAFSAGASAQGNTGALLPAHFDDFVQGVFGLHTLQVLKELDKWTDPDRKLSDLIAGVAVPYAEEFLTKVTGIDAKTAFATARERLVSLLTAWHALPHRVASTVLSTVQHQPALVPDLKAQLTKVATSDLTAFQPELQVLLGHVDFFKTPFGQWLESAALTSALTAASDRAEYARVQQIATQTLAVLDGSIVERTLGQLQGELDQRLGLDRIEHVVDQATFEKADEWLKARLAAFLGKAVDLPQVQQVRVAITRLRGLQETFFQQAKSALARKYEAQLLATYQKATTQTALLDVLFDYDAAHASAASLTRLAMAAIDGDYEQVLVQDTAGVSLRQAVLTHEIKRQTHLDVTLPFDRVEMDHLNTSLAKTEAVDADRGRILLYDLHADDLKTAKGKFSSRLTVNARFAQLGATRVFDEQSMTHSYSFRQGVPMMRRRAFEAQMRTYAETYFPGTFGTGEASLTTWVTDLDRTVDKVLDNGPDNFGNTLLALDVSAPSALVGAWALAPASAKAPPYFAMSRAIQAQLRRLIPLAYFQDPAKYRDRVPSAALLVYASMPPTTGITVENGRVMEFDRTSDVYPDIDSSGQLPALVQHSRTLAALTGRLVTVHDVLQHADGMGSVAPDYHPDRAGRVLADALTPNGLADLQNMLVVERGVIRGAHAAGIAIAGFLEATNSSDARRSLAEYGAKVTDAFNSKIGGLFTGTELRAFGTLVFLEAARAFDPRLESVPPGALLRVTVLKDQPSVPLASLADGADIPATDIVDVETIVSLGHG